MENINEIAEALTQMTSSKPIMEFRENEYSEFVLRVYYNYGPDNEDDEIIRKNRRLWYAFLERGYVSAGLGSFEGCTNERSLSRNAVKVKVAHDIVTDEIVALSVYSGHPTGTKCTGITRIYTEDERLTDIGKKALIHIIKEDVSEWQDFVWCECSGAIKHYWEKFGAIKIPFVYLPLFMDPKKLSTVKQIDEYDYTRVISNQVKVQKCVFGFPSQSVLDKYIKDTNTTLDEIKKKFEQSVLGENVLFEMNPTADRVAYYLIVQYFMPNMHDEHVFELTEHQAEILKWCIKILDGFIANNNRMLQGLVSHKITSACEEAKSIYNLSSIIKPYKLGDDFISESDEYELPTDEIDEEPIDWDTRAAY